MQQGHSDLKPPDPIEAAKSQDMFTRMMDMCWKKCVSKYFDNEVTLGEGLCIDRCIKKYAAVDRLAATHIFGLANIFAESQKENMKLLINQNESIPNNNNNN